MRNDDRQFAAVQGEAGTVSVVRDRYRPECDKVPYERDGHRELSLVQPEDQDNEEAEGEAEGGSGNLFHSQEVPEGGEWEVEMKTIYKYSIPIENFFSLNLPLGAKILTFQIQMGKHNCQVVCELPQKIQKSPNETH